MRVLSRNVETDVCSHLTWLSDPATHFPPMFSGFSSLSPLIHHLITSPRAYQYVTPRSVRVQFRRVSKCHFMGRKWNLCVGKAQCCRQCSRKFFFFFFFSFSLSLFCPRHMFEAVAFPSSLSASPRDRSICVRPLKEFADSCLRLFSLPGCDCKSPQAPGKGSGFHSSLSTQLLVT